MSKILLINGSPNEHGCTDAALQEIAGELHRQGVDSEILWLGKKPMQDGIACCQCQKTGQCVFADTVNETANRMDAFDGRRYIMEVQMEGLHPFSIGFSSQWIRKNRRKVCGIGRVLPTGRSFRIL